MTACGETLSARGCCVLLIASTTPPGTIGCVYLLNVLKSRPSIPAR